MAVVGPAGGSKGKSDDPTKKSIAFSLQALKPVQVREETLRKKTPIDPTLDGGREEGIESRKPGRRNVRLKSAKFTHRKESFN